MKEPKIKYPLDESFKQVMRDRLEEVLARTDGHQVIILWDKDKLTDYYQNTCTACLIDGIKVSARDYAKASGGKLIADTLPKERRKSKFKLVSR